MSDHIELKRRAEEILEIERLHPCGSTRVILVNPETVLALIAEVDELKVDSLCPACEGSGEGWVRSDSGPDAHNIQVDCPECFGPGTMLGAYQAMKIQRDSQIERTVNAGGDLLFMRAERDQLKAEVEALRKEIAALKPSPIRTDKTTIGYTGCIICGQYTDHGGLQCPNLAARSLSLENQRVMPVEPIRAEHPLDALDRKLKP